MLKILVYPKRIREPVDGVRAISGTHVCGHTLHPNFDTLFFLIAKMTKPLNDLLALILLTVGISHSAVAMSQKEEREAIAQMYAQHQFLEGAEAFQRYMDKYGKDAASQMSMCNGFKLAGEMGKLARCLEDLKAFRPVEYPALHDGDGRSNMLKRLAISQIHHALALGYLALGDYKAVLAQAPGGLAQMDGEASKINYLVLVAKAHLGVGDMAAAGKIFAEIEAVQPESREFRARIRSETNPAIQGDIYLAIETMQMGSVKGVRYMALYQLGLGIGSYEAALRYQDAYAAHMLTVQTDRTKAASDPALRKVFNDWDAAMALMRAAPLIGLKRFSEARSEQDRADQLNPFACSGIWECSLDRGLVHEGLGDFDRAIAHYKVAIELVESQRSTIRGEEARIAFSTADRQEAYARLVALLVRKGEASEALEYAERAKSRALVDLLASRRSFDNGAGAKAASSKALLDDVRKIEQELSVQQKDRSEQQAQTRAVLGEALARIKKDAPELAALVSVSYTPTADLQARLQPDVTLVEYYGFKNHLFAFVANRDKVRGFVLDAGVLAQVNPFREALRDPLSKNTQELGRRLHAKLIEPLGLPSRGRLVVVPHAALHYLPFAALNSGKDLLLDRYVLRVLPSASAFVMLAQRSRPANGRMLILGNPDLNDRQYDLPGAQKESEELSRLQPNSKLLMRHQATRDAVFAEGKHYGYLHFASHGIFDASAPRSSGLLLALPAGRKQPAEGMLSVDDLYSLELSADLVTMSACETAVADVQSGDDLVGLNRGFFFAGANNVLSSLWPVDDTATQMLMVQFYRFLETLPKAEALRKAQQTVRAKYPHPFYWAAFQLSGADAVTR